MSSSFDLVRPLPGATFGGRLVQTGAAGCMVHATTWFDADRLQRVMWRTTVSGNPGPACAGEAKSWITA